MRIDDKELAEIRPSPESPIDFGFLTAQSLGDIDLEQELLELFLAQSERVVASLPRLSPPEQADAAHLLKGSARAIGAWRAAATAEVYEHADTAMRPARLADLIAAFAEVERAIRVRLQTRGA